ncbi:MAG TPA: hypothetical protein HA256_06070 [Methanoregulaceae archaeon]|nr:hypothetical protein [Methanoregulaceae archaeon]
MKRWIIVLFVIALFAGFVQADRGINPTPETQGIVTTTLISADGRFLSSSDLSISTTDDSKGITGIPPLRTIPSLTDFDSFFDFIEWFIFEWDWDIEVSDGLILRGQYNGAAVYDAVYTEDTVSNGQGVFDYTKILDVDTSEKVMTQSNIETTKILTYDGGNSGRVFSEEGISIGSSGSADPLARIGLGLFTPAPDPRAPSGRSMCRFAGLVPSVIPAFCNSADAGSSIDMRQAQVTTASSSRFITPSADTPVLLSHDIRVIDSVGKASAGMDVMAMEGRSMEEFLRGTLNLNGQTIFDAWLGISSDDLYQTTSFSESTQVDGIITTFDKNMVYESGMRR